MNFCLPAIKFTITMIYEERGYQIYEERGYHADDLYPQKTRGK